jgi:hypothetical protein
MADSRSIQKLPEQARFHDLSDYARPLAGLIVSALLPTRVSPIHITLAYTALGLMAGGLFAAGTYGGGLMAGLLLLAKSALDAADGSLARARGRPSRVGRYLDSVCDFVVNLAAFGGLAFAEAGRTGSAWAYLVAGAALIVATLEGSVFNFYNVLQRRRAGGDPTSLLDEREAQPYPWDHPGLTAALQAAYLAIYGWQDRFVARLDRLATGISANAPTANAPTANAPTANAPTANAPTANAPTGEASAAPSAAFLTATTALGLGTQLLVIAAFAAAGRPFWSMYVFLGPGMIVWASLLATRTLRR